MKKILLSAFLLASGLVSFGQTKVIGYLVVDRGWQYVDQINWSSMSHVILTGITPDKVTGEWSGPFNAKEVIEKIREKNPCITIMPSVVGKVEFYEEWIEQQNGKRRETIINNLVDYLIDNDFDGVDIDLEGSAITSSWPDFIFETKAAIKQHDLLYSGAHAGWYQGGTTKAAIEAFDWINIMSYDDKGSWRPNDPGQHSSMEGTAKAYRYFNNNFTNIASENLAIGIPTYGYWFGGGTAGDFAYSIVVDLDPANADVDDFVREGKTYYYNGRPIVREKVKYAQDNNTNLMIFRLGTDAMNQYSIMSAIQDEMARLGMDLYCKDDASNSNPIAKFDHSFDGTCGAGALNEGGEVAFEDQTLKNPTAWSWTFEGGTPSTSSLQNPTVVYNTPGNYDVQLIVTNADGKDTLNKQDLINVTTLTGGNDEVFVSIDFENGIEDLSSNQFNLATTYVSRENNNKFSDVTNNYGVFNTNSTIEVGSGDLSGCLPTEEFTVSCLVYKTTTENYGGYVGYFQDNGATEFGMVLGNMGDKFSMGLCTNDDPTISYITSADAYNLNQWYHVVATYDGNSLKLYVDGVLSTERTQEGGSVIWPPNAVFAVGRYKDDDEDFGFGGNLDEVNLYKDAMTAKEVEDLYSVLKGTVSRSFLQNEGLKISVSNNKLKFLNDAQVLESKIYDAQGKLVKIKLGSHSIIDLSNLKSGIYVVLSKNSQNKYYKTKFVK